MIKSELVQRIAEHNPHLYQRMSRISSTRSSMRSCALARGDGFELRGLVPSPEAPSGAGWPQSAHRCHVPVDQKSVRFQDGQGNARTAEPHNPGSRRLKTGLCGGRRPSRDRADAAADWIKYERPLFAKVLSALILIPLA